MSRFIHLLLCLALAAAAACEAQTWPAKPVKIIVSTGSGSTPDRIARVIADRLAKDLGQAFVVENMTGGGGVISARAALRAAPDGYTLFFGAVDTLVTNPYTVKDLGYDPERDFEPVSMIYKEGALAVALHPSVPAKNLPELFALARKEPGKLSYGTSSINFVILFGRWLNKLAGTEMLAVVYNSPAQQFQDVLAGRIHFVISSPPTMDAQMKAGKLRVIAIDGTRRYPLWPDVPTIGETFPGFRLSGTGVLVAPKKTPEEALRTAHRAMQKIVADPTYQQMLLQMGFTVDDAGTPDSIRQHLSERREYWQKVFAGLNVVPE